MSLPGTVGGNLCQGVRCWYYRHPEIRCWLKGGETCYARKGLNRHHAVLGKCPCVAVNPSDLAPALLALDATARIVHPGGTRDIPLESLYRLPDAERRSQTMLSSGELLSFWGTSNTPCGGMNAQWDLGCRHTKSPFN